MTWRRLTVSAHSHRLQHCNEIFRHLPAAAAARTAATWPEGIEPQTFETAIPAAAPGQQHKALQQSVRRRGDTQPGDGQVGCIMHCLWLCD